ncbi:MAG: hypothetical protein IT579_25415 [Verrucomicrobia subdivision 3 bacterium]|nr:hypothetical protein [Limisphaerales bacterium]
METKKIPENHQEKSGDENEFIYTVTEFILYTCGYYELIQKKNSDSYINEDVQVALTAAASGFVSGVSSVFSGKLKMAAMAVEFFLNNRMQTEMIFRIAKDRNQVPEKEEFISCLSGGFLEEKFLPKNVSPQSHLDHSASEEIFRNSVQAIFGSFAAKTILKFSPVAKSLMSGFYSFLETYRIADATREIYDEKK